MLAPILGGPALVERVDAAVAGLEKPVPWAAAVAGVDLAEAATQEPELRDALAAFA